MKDITISTGLVVTLDEECFNDIELLEALVSIEKGDISLLPETLEKIFGEDKKRFYDSMRNEKGRVPIDAVMEEIKGIISTLGHKNF